CKLAARPRLEQVPPRQADKFPEVLRPFRPAFYDVLAPKRLWKLAVVRSQKLSNDVWRKFATKCAVSDTNNGSLRLPRCGTGARYGQSVSTRIRSSGRDLAISARDSDLGKVTIPEKEI